MLNSTLEMSRTAFLNIILNGKIRQLYKNEKSTLHNRPPNKKRKTLSGTEKHVYRPPPTLRRKSREQQMATYRLPLPEDLSFSVLLLRNRFSRSTHLFFGAPLVSCRAFEVQLLGKSTPPPTLLSSSPGQRKICKCPTPALTRRANARSSRRGAGSSWNWLMYYSCYYGGPIVSRQFQFYSFTAFSICSRLFQFADGNFNFKLLTAISIYPRLRSSFTAWINVDCKEIGKAWRKSLTRAKRASLTRPTGVWGERKKNWLSVFHTVYEFVLTRGFKNVVELSKLCSQLHPLCEFDTFADWFRGRIARVIVGTWLRILTLYPVISKVDFIVVSLWNIVSIVKCSIYI